jgi:hypothetical protein
VNATLAHPRRWAASAIASGDAVSASVSNSRDFEMSQFWQKRQPRLQPAVPNERTDVPGRKWLSGFFSTGSTQNPLDRPYVVRTISSPSRARTKQNPRWPSRSRQPRGHTSHCTRPSATRCQCFVATIPIRLGSSLPRSIGAGSEGHRRFRRAVLRVGGFAV